MNSMKRQQGQTLGGMILGILITVVILGGAFWFFSQQKAPYQPEVVTKETPAPQPEIIVPNDGLESILHKDPSEWLNSEEPQEPATTGEGAKPTEPVQPKVPAKTPDSKPTPDALGAFIEKDLAVKEHLVVESKPVTPVPAKVEPKPVEKKAEPTPAPAKQPEPTKKPEAAAKPEPKPEPSKKPEAESKPATAKKPVEAAKGGTLQAGAYRTQGQAEEQKVKLALMGYTANVIKSDLGDKGIMYRVRMGVKDVQGAKADLAGKGVDVMLVR
ncbi:MAG: SPOR domain-containing protein [Neisseriaceae bacterium]|nr:SPOR domain-containing protein [Neisseriaceae bacterium]